MQPLFTTVGEYRIEQPQDSVFCVVLDHPTPTGRLYLGMPDLFRMIARSPYTPEQAAAMIRYHREQETACLTTT